MGPFLIAQQISSVDWLGGTAGILRAVAWPLLLGFVLLFYHSTIRRLLDVITKKIEAATKVKMWQFEVETKEEQVAQVLTETARDAPSELRGEIPRRQIEAAEEVKGMLADGQLSGRQVDRVVRGQIDLLVDEYQSVRVHMESGGLRTRKMNEIAAKMRALGTAARSLVRSLTLGELPGERLAAICILQVAPEFGFFHWLIDRIKQEDQPFIFFQASIAVLEVVKGHFYSDADMVRHEIEGAIAHLTGFQGGTPDQNTIDVLKMAHSQVR
jgi:hypothetical protein